MGIKSLIALAVILVSNISIASTIELHDNCESISNYITAQDEVDQILGCLYLNRKNTNINREPAARQLLSVASTLIINIDQLRASIPEAMSSTLERLYISIASEQYKANAENKIIGARRNKSAEREGKYNIEIEKINKKYSYHYLERLGKRDTAQYLDVYEKKLSELERVVISVSEGDIEEGYKSTFRDDYNRLGDYAAYVAGEPERAIDYYLKSVEYKVVPKKHTLTEFQKNEIRKRMREFYRQQRHAGNVSAEPNSPCYKIYKLLNNRLPDRHRAYIPCKGQLEEIGIQPNSMFDFGDNDLKLKSSVLEVKVKLVEDNEGKPLRYASKVLIESAYKDLGEHFCNELQLVEVDGSGEGTITVRKNRYIRATILDRDWKNDSSEEGVKLSVISTHEHSTRFNEIVLRVKSVGVGVDDIVNHRLSLAKTSSLLKGCREHNSPSKTMVELDKIFYLSANFSVSRPHTTMAVNNGLRNNAVLSSYYEEIAYADELTIFKHGALHRLALAPKRYNKADLYNLEVGILLDQVGPLRRFVEKYGASAISSYFGDECSFTSYVLSIYGSRGRVNREIEKVLRLYEKGRDTHISRDKFLSNIMRYENAKSAYENMEGFHSSVADFSVKNSLMFSGKQGGSSCNKVFIDEFLSEVARNNDADAIRLAVKLGVNPNYELSYGGPFITVFSRSQDVVVALLELGADPMIEAASGMSLRTISINQKYKKIISYYISHNLIIGAGITNYAKLFNISMDDPEDTRKLLSHLASADEAAADEIVQAAAVTGRVDILEVMFDSGVKVKKFYDSPIAGRHNSVTHSIDGSYEEFLVLNATRGKFLDNTLKTIDILVRNGADVNSHSQGVTAISYAVRFSQYKLILKLIELGADPAFTPEGGTPALLSASKRGLDYSNGCFSHIPIIASAVKEYLDSNKDAPDREEYEKCLISVSEQDMTERTESEYRVIELLINNHVSINVNSRFGRTPLMLYALKGDERVVNLLLKYGAKPDAKDAYGKTYHDYRKVTTPHRTTQSPTGKAYLGGGTMVTVPGHP